MLQFLGIFALQREASLAHAHIIDFVANISFKFNKLFTYHLLCTKIKTCVYKYAPVTCENTNLDLFGSDIYY